jgi:hypothetical protein
VYLLDTNAFRNYVRRPNRAVIAWLFPPNSFPFGGYARRPAGGVEITRRQDPEKSEEIEAWADTDAATNEVLPVDGVIFRRWAKLSGSEGIEDKSPEPLEITHAARHNRKVVHQRGRRDQRVFNQIIRLPVHKRPGVQIGLS